MRRLPALGKKEYAKRPCGSGNVGEHEGAETFVHSHVAHPALLLPLRLWGRLPWTSPVGSDDPLLLKLEGDVDGQRVETGVRDDEQHLAGADVAHVENDRAR